MSSRVLARAIGVFSLHKSERSNFSAASVEREITMIPAAPGHQLASPAKLARANPAKIKRYSSNTSATSNKAAPRQAQRQAPRPVSRKSLVSHAISDYSTRFRPYESADVLIVDDDPVVREKMRAKTSKVVIKGFFDPSWHTHASGGGLLIDEGRNATVNTCCSKKEAYHRLINLKETYALVMVRDTRFDDESDISLVRTLREAGYDNAIAVLVDTCSYMTSAKARDHRADACLVRHTGSLTLELTSLLASLCIRGGHRTTTTTPLPEARPTPIK